MTINEGIHFDTIQSYTPEHLEHIARFVAQIRSVAIHFADPEAAVEHIVSITHVIDGILIAQGLPCTLPDFALAEALERPDYEVFGRSSDEEVFDGYKEYFAEKDLDAYPDNPGDPLSDMKFELGISDSDLLAWVHYRFDVDYDSVNDLPAEMLSVLYQDGADRKVQDLWDVYIARIREIRDVRNAVEELIND